MNKIKNIIFTSLLVVLVSLGVTACTQPTIPNTEYKVSYESAYGKAPKSKTVAENTKLTKEDLPSLTDSNNLYKFVCWNDANGNEVSVGYEVKSDLKLIAKWNKVLSIDSISSDKNRYKFGEDIKITIKGKNLDLIDRATSSLKLFLNQEGESTLLNESTNFTIDKATNTAIFNTKIEPKNDILKENGYGNITAKVLLNENSLDKEIDFVVSANPSIWNNTQYSADSIKIHKDDSVTDFIYNYEFYGLAFDLVKNVEVQLFDSNGKEVKNPVKIDISKVTAANTKFSVPVPIPNIEGKYEIKVKIDSVIQDTYYYYNTKKTLPTYEVLVIPQIDITELRIPRASLSYKGKDLIIVIKGKNLSSTDTFEIKLDDKPLDTPASFEYFNPTTIKATMKIPSTAGNYKIKVISNNKTMEGNLEVKDFSSYKLGDIILKDGTIKSLEEFTITDKDKDLAIVGGFNSFGVPLAFALYDYHKYTEVMWSKPDAITYNKAITTIEAIPKRFNEFDLKKVDVWGNDNWKEIKEADPEGSKIKGTYPAFDFVTTFATNQNITVEHYKEGWFIPSLTELESIKENMPTLITTLNSIRDITNYDRYSIWNGFWWSSTTINKYPINNKVFILGKKGENNTTGNMKISSESKDKQGLKMKVLPVHEVF